VKQKSPESPKAHAKIKKSGTYRPGLGVTRTQRDHALQPSDLPQERSNGYAHIHARAIGSKQRQ
jgi:hypothetical protein